MESIEIDVTDIVPDIINTVGGLDTEDLLTPRDTGVDTMINTPMDAEIEEARSISPSTTRASSIR